jgi:hypothetical protein
MRCSAKPKGICHLPVKKIRAVGEQSPDVSGRDGEHDCRDYLRDLLTRLPALLPGASRDMLRSLLPDRWQPAQ